MNRFERKKLEMERPDKMMRYLFRNIVRVDYDFNTLKIVTSDTVYFFGREGLEWKYEGWNIN